MEHISGHHKKLATIEDPATPVLGDNLYGFALRSAVVGYVNTVKREFERIEQIQQNLKRTDGISRIYAHLVKNKMVSFTLAQSLYAFAIYYTFGLKALGF